MVSRRIPSICTSTDNTVCDAAPAKRCGTSPRFAKSSSKRGMTPGSGRAWTENRAVTGRAPSSARAATKERDDDIGQNLGKAIANKHGPSPGRARVANSPIAGKRCRPDHAPNVSRPLAPVKPAFGRSGSSPPLGCQRHHAHPEHGLVTDIDIVFAQEGQLAVIADAEHR